MTLTRLAILGYEGVSKESVSAPSTVRSSVSLMTAQTGSSHRITAELCCKIQVTVTHTPLTGTPRNVGMTEIAISTPVTACTCVTRLASIADHLSSDIDVTRGAKTTVFLSQQGDKEKNKRAAN